MPTASLNREKTEVCGGNDSIVIIKDLGDIPGGRTLDVSNVASGTEVIRAGHVLKYTADGDIAPLGITAGTPAGYSALGEGESYAGVLKSTIRVADPRAAILTMGQVNAAASPYPVTDSIKAGLPQINFIY